MEIQFYGANCIRLSTKKAAIVIDDNLADLGAKSITRPDDIALFTHLSPNPKGSPRLVIADPGEYEVSEISIIGVAAQSHLDEKGSKTATIYKLEHDDIRLAVMGHIYPDLDDDQLEELGMIDVLITPVGGNGFTLDATGALQLIKKIEPKIVIPTHYDLPGLNYPVPQQPLSEVVKNLSMEPKETTAKYKVKPADFGETAQLIVLERQ